MKMVDMARAPAKSKTLGLVADSLRDKYGYGTSITLDAESLKKLGIKDLPKVGDTIEFEAKAKVISTSQNASESNASTRVELQITHMGLDEESVAEERAEERKHTFGLSGVKFK